MLSQVRFTLPDMVAEADQVDRSFVTKTNVVDFERCPYAFLLLDRGVVTRDKAVTRGRAQRMAAGVAFEARVVSSVEPGPPAASVEELLCRDDDIFIGYTFINRSLRLAGIPDGVRPAGGEVVPIEVKDHAYPTRRDAIELAFYWLLLEPYRTRVGNPRGIVIGNRRGEHAEVDVELTDDHFDTVIRLIDGVRLARRDGVVPDGLCECFVCAGPGRSALIADLLARRHVSLLWSVGPVFSKGLSELHLDDFSALAKECPDAVAIDLRLAGYTNVSSKMVQRWQHHAAALLHGQPVLFAERRRVGRRFIAIDLEYTSQAVWLIAVAVVDGRRRSVRQFWADDRAELKDALVHLGQLVSSNPRFPVVTWSGNGADLPQLEAAAWSTGTRRAIRPILERHVDAFAEARDALRLPIVGMSVKDVAAYFGFERSSTVSDGREAVALYGRYQRCESKRERRALQQELLDYSREDLEMLVSAVRRLDRLLG